MRKAARLARGGKMCLCRGVCKYGSKMSLFVCIHREMKKGESFSRSKAKAAIRARRPIKYKRLTVLLRSRLSQANISPDVDRKDVKFSQPSKK